MREDERICAAVWDLVPLWREGLISVETAAFLDRHLAECPTCAARWGANDPAAAGRAPDEGQPTKYMDPTRQFWRRLRRRTAMLAVAAAVLVLAAGATGAALARSQEKTPAERYAAFLRTVPGYMAAAADGSLIPLRRTLTIGGERVTLRSFHATYFGSYVVFTAERSDGLSATLPSIASSPDVGAVAGTSAPTGDGEIAGYIDLTALQVPTPFTAPENRTPLTHVALRMSLPSRSGSVALALPSSAYQPKGVRVLRHPMTVQAGQATVRFERLEVSSAGTLIEGEVRGLAQPAYIDLPVCPAFVGRAACGPVDSTSQTLPSQAGWQPFYVERWAPTQPTSMLRNVVLPLAGGVRVVKGLAVSQQVQWPLAFPSGPASAQISLGTVGRYAVRLLPAGETVIPGTPRALTVQVVPTEKTQPLPAEMALRSLSVTLPDGTALDASGGGTGEGGSTGDWFYLFPATWKASPTAAQFTETGMATVRMTLSTYLLLPFPKGLIWHP